MNNNRNLLKSIMKKYDNQKTKKKPNKDNTDLREFGFISNSKARPDLNLVKKDLTKILGTYEDEKKLYSKKDYDETRKVVNRGLKDKHEFKINNEVSKQRVKRAVVEDEEDDMIYYEKYKTFQEENKQYLKSKHYVSDVSSINPDDIKAAYEDLVQRVKSKKNNLKQYFDLDAEEEEIEENEENEDKSELESLFGIESHSISENKEEEKKEEDLNEVNESSERVSLNDFEEDDFEEKEKNIAKLLNENVKELKKNIKIIEDELSEEIIAVNVKDDEQLKENEIRLVKKYRRISKYKKLVKQIKKHKKNRLRRKKILQLAQRINNMFKDEFNLNEVKQTDDEVILNLFMTGQLDFIENYLRRKKRKQNQH